MRDYRLFLFDPAGRQSAAYDFPAPSDRDAVRFTQEAAAGEHAALWCGPVLLLRIDGRWPERTADAVAPAA